MKTATSLKKIKINCNSLFPPPPSTLENSRCVSLSDRLQIHPSFLSLSEPIRSPLCAMAMDQDLEKEVMVEGEHSQAMQIDPKRSRFPCCIVWTPLPVLSWFIPFIGHIGICREDGVILDFAGPNYVCVDHFSFGSATRYLQLDKEKVPSS